MCSANKENVCTYVRTLYVQSLTKTLIHLHNLGSPEPGMERIITIPGIVDVMPGLYGDTRCVQPIRRMYVHMSELCMCNVSLMH